MKLEIKKSNGDWFDVTPYIAYQGLKWQRSDVDTSEATRDTNGLLIRNRVATKIRLDVTCKPLKTQELKRILSVIMPEFITVRYVDPYYSTYDETTGEWSLTVKTMYSNNHPASYCQNYGDYELWHDVTFPLIEQ